MGDCPAGGPFAYNTGLQPVGPISASDDGGSGVDVAGSTLSGQVDTSSLGVQSVTFAAVDNAGNASLPKTCDYYVTIVVAKQEVLEDLVALRATAADKQDGNKLDQAIQHLTQSLDPDLWLDGSHLEPKHGHEVFGQEKDAVNKLRNLLKDKKSTIPAAVLQGFIDRLVGMDRALAQVAIGDAVSATGDAKMIAKANAELAKGDSEVAEAKYESGIEHYRNAWEHAQKAL